VPYVVMKNCASDSGAVECREEVAVAELHNKTAVVEARGMSTCRAGHSMKDCTVVGGSPGDGSRSPLLSEGADVLGGDWKIVLSPKTCWAR
jgi:hypothetical protein